MTAHAHEWGAGCGPSRHRNFPMLDPRWVEFFTAMTGGRGPDRSGEGRGGRGPGRPDDESGGRGPGRPGGRHGRGPRGGPGGPPWGGFPGGGFPGGGRGGFGGGRRGRGPRAGRGDVRAALLLVLEEQETANGYQLMQEIEERSHGTWRPSPGSVYPSLQQLEDEGLVQGEQRGNGRFFTLTDDGRRHIDEHRQALGTPWEAASEGVSDQTWQLGSVMREVGFAAFQVVQAGTPAQQTAAAEILADTRRRLYRILAEGEADEPTTAPDEGERPAAPPTTGDGTEG